LNQIIFFFDLVYDHEDEATGDNRTLFSEIQLSGDIDESASNANTLDADFRLSRLRRSPLDDQRVSSATSRSVVNDNKVIQMILIKSMFGLFSRNFRV
jgi:hypothetical protein